MFKEFLLCSACLVSLLFIIDKTHAHPDGATPYWYPSTFIYGYINGCYEATEQNQVPFIKDMWPDNIKNICGCVVDAMRHSLTFEEMMDNASHERSVLIAQATLPLCVDQEYKDMMNKE